MLALLAAAINMSMTQSDLPRLSSGISENSATEVMIRVHRAL